MYNISHGVIIFMFMYMFKRPTLYRNLQVITCYIFIDMLTFCLFKLQYLINGVKKKSGQIVHGLSFPKANLATGKCSVSLQKLIPSPHNGTIIQSYKPVSWWQLFILYLLLLLIEATLYLYSNIYCGNRFTLPVTFGGTISC